MVVNTIEYFLLVFTDIINFSWNLHVKFPQRNHLLIFYKSKNIVNDAQHLHTLNLIVDPIDLIFYS